MTLSLLLSTLNIAQWLGDNVWNLALTVLAILGLFGIQIIPPHRKRKWRRDTIHAKLLNEFKSYIPKSKKEDTESVTPDQEVVEGNIYVQPNINILPPPNHQIAKSSYRLCDFFFKNVFVKTPVNKVFFLLGNTGSGKTAALAHLLIDYINRHSRRTLPYDIFILSLRPNDIFEKIKNIKVKDNMHAILLLDALDENHFAQDPKQQKTFFENLKKEVYRDTRFAAIVVSCRNQFYKDVSEEPALTDIVTGGDNPYLQIWRLQLEQFTEDQVWEYIDQRFGISNHSDSRSKFIEYINKHRNNKEIAFRPLILTYIRDLVEANETFETTLDFYFFIVQKELRRSIIRTEQPVTDELLRQWWNMTVQVSVFLCNKRKPNTKADRNDYLTYEELLSIILENNITLPNNAINEDLFQQRSLLTRDNEGFRFSHRSFFEFFLAYHFLLRPKEIKYIGGLDFALEIFDQLYGAFTKGDKKPFSMLNAEVKEEDFAFAYLSISSSLDDLNHFSKALPRGQKAVDIFSRLSQTDSDTYLQYKAGALNNLANLHSRTNNPAAAEEEYTEALNIHRSLAEANPVAFLPRVADTLNNLGALHADTDNHAAAKEAFTEALSIRRSLAEANPEAFLPDVADTLNNLGTLHADAAAEKEYTEALSIYRSLAEANPSLAEANPDAFLPDVATTLNNLANLHRITNNHTAAEEEYTEALNIYRSLAEANPDAFLPDEAMTLYNLGILHADTNNLTAAEEEYTKALSTCRSLAEANPDAFLPRVADTLNNLANLHCRTYNHPAAEEEFTEALRIRRSLAEANPKAFLPRVADTLNNLANLHCRTNNHPAAEEEFTEALRIRRSLAEANRDAFLPGVAMTLNDLGNLHKDIDNYTAAEEEYTEALSIRRSLAEANPDAFLPRVADTLNNLGNLHCVNDNYTAAEEEYTEALNIRRSLAEANPDAFLPDVAQTLFNIALLHLQKEDWDEAERAAQESLDKYRTAEEEYTEALNTRRSLAEANPDAFLPDVAQTLFNIALLHLQKGELDEAERAAQESLDKFRTMAEKSYVAFDMNVKKGEEFLADIQKLRTMVGGTELGLTGGGTR